MTNTSILAAFERMWQHVVAALGNKADIDHTHESDGSSIYVQANEPTDAQSGALWVDTDADMCNITYNLTNCTSNNIIESITFGEPYTATFTCSSAYMMVNYIATIDGKPCGTFTRNNSRSVTLDILAITGDLIITVDAGN